jgi:hypothetical protein
MTFGRLTVLRDSGERTKTGFIVWECSCECGTITRVRTSNLTSGHTKSCGCLLADSARDQFRSHGMSTSQEGFMVYTARQRAKRLRVPCTISVEDIHIPDRCPALGIPIISGAGRQNGSPSLDRIRPELGYVPGNVAVISDLANRIKQNASSAQVRAVGQWMRSNGL